MTAGRGEEGAVLRAAKKLTDAVWTEFSEGVFCAEIGETADGLYINGTPYRMARYPGYDPDTPIFGGYAADCISPVRAAGWKDPRGGYIHAMHARLWGGFSYKITGKTEENTLEYEGGWQNNRPMGMHGEYRFVENIFEELTSPGEFFYDEIHKRIYVIPHSGDDPAEAEITVNTTFFELDGCRGVTIENLTFEYSSRTFMQTKEPLLRSDWTIYRGGAVHIKNSTDCTVGNCHFAHIGSNGVFVDGNCENIAVRNSLFREIGGSGVCFVGTPDSVRDPLFAYGETQSIRDMDLTPGPRGDSYPKNCRVDNCLITRIGTAEKQTAGVQISMAYRISVTNCSIYDVPRAGINISEGTFGGHLIEGCDVFDTVRETGDHGSFNSWGRDRFWHAEDLEESEARRYALLDCIEPTIIRGNRFRCERGWDIDLDDGSSNYIMENNLCLNGGIKLREGFYRRVHHNITVNNTVHFHVWYPDSGDCVENNIVFQPYKPIRMPPVWGECIDGNILHRDSAEGIRPARELHALSGTDRHSVAADCRFRDPKNGDYTVTNDRIGGFEHFPSVFGVQYPPLKAIAKVPEMPDLRGAEPERAKSAFAVHGIRVKNVDTDDEMSAFGTAGHNGVIVLDVPADSPAAQKGLREGDVIIGTERGEIRSAADLIKIENL